MPLHLQRHDEKFSAANALDADTSELELDCRDELVPSGIPIPFKTRKNYKYLCGNISIRK